MTPLHDQDPIMMGQNIVCFKHAPKYVNYIKKE